jgi:hypothetical protein
VREGTCVRERKWRSDHSILLLLLLKGCVPYDYSCCVITLLISSNSVSSLIFMLQRVMLLSLSRCVSLLLLFQSGLRLRLFKIVPCCCYCSTGCHNITLVQHCVLLFPAFGALYYCNICTLQISSYPVSLCILILVCAVLFSLFYIVLLILLF